MFGSAVWIAPAIFATMSEIGQRRMQGRPAPSLAELLFTGGDWLMYGLIAPAIYAVCNRWPVVKPVVRQRVLLHLGFALITCVVWAVGGKIFQYGLNYLLEREQQRRFLAELQEPVWQAVTSDVLGWIFITLPFGVIVYTVVAVLAHASRYLSVAQDREVQLAKVSEQLSGARFAALQAQLNPHFLFNTLNTIAVRARDGDGAGTARMVEQLSDVLRRTLTRHKSSEVTLGEELELVRQYVAIEEARFVDRLAVTIDADASLHDAALPGFALQHLVENAIRHGVARQPGAGTVLVRAQRIGSTLEVTVSDDGPGFNESIAIPSGHGIENTRERLRVLYGDQASLTVARRAEGGTTATLRVPFHIIALESDLAQR
jgi:two-component system LytT family sensor kinase